MRLTSSAKPWRSSSTRPNGSRNFTGQSGRPPAFIDISLLWKLARKNGQENQADRRSIAGNRKKTMPKTSVQSLRRGEAEP